MHAGIKIWVLTGDKQETAIEIGKSCNLINEEQMELIILSSDSSNDFERKLKDAVGSWKKDKRMSIVIDGQTLTYVLENHGLS